MGTARYRQRKMLPPLRVPRLGPPRSRDRLVPGTHVTVEELIEMMVRDHDCGRLFRWYPGLDPDAVRDALDRASDRHPDR